MSKTHHQEELENIVSFIDIDLKHIKSRTLESISGEFLSKYEFDLLLGIYQKLIQGRKESYLNMLNQYNSK